jgi:ammonium transporter, Amt family
VISVSAGADVYAPTLGYLIAMASAALTVWAGNWIEKKMRVDDVVGAVAVHGVAGFLGLLWVGIFAAGYPTGVNNVDSSLWGQLLGIATFLPLGFLTGWVASFVLKKLNLLRVPPEVELAGLDVVEFHEDLYLPEVGRVRERIIEPDGTIVEAEAILIEAETEVLRR